MVRAWRCLQRLAFLKSWLVFICVGLVGAELTELATKIDLNVAAYIRLIGYLLTLKVADVITKKVESNRKLNLAKIEQGWMHAEMIPVME